MPGVAGGLIVRASGASPKNFFAPANGLEDGEDREFLARLCHARRTTEPAPGSRTGATSDELISQRPA